MASVGHTSASPSRSTARPCGNLRMSPWRAALRPATFLGVRDSLPGFLQRQQDVFPMFHEVLRGPFPPRVLPFLAAVLFQRKERKDTGFYHWRVRQIPVLSEMEFLSRGARERLPLAARVENHCGPSAGIKKFIVSQAFLLMVMLMEI